MDSPDSNYGQALSLIAHELSSPASIVNGYLRLLLQLDVDRLTDQQRRMLEQTGVACTRMLGIIRELGDLAALENNDPVRPPSRVPVFSLCEDVLASVARDGGNAAPNFTCAVSDRSAVVDGDPGSLQRAFRALMAATAREHATYQLECRGFVSHDPESHNAVIVFGRQGLLATQDDILTNRATFDRWRGGTGLSVPIACRIIESYGGSVWCSATGEPRSASVWSLPIVAPASL